MKVYGSEPVKVAQMTCDTDEMFFYQYLPIKMAGSLDIRLPERLNCFIPIITLCNADFYEFGRGIQGQYIYLTAKRMFVQPGCGLNRPGWHTDGFGSNDINYIWCDSLPTVYVTGLFTGISEDHNESLSQFEDIAYQNAHALKQTEVNTIYRLDDTVIHAQNELAPHPFIRTFVKVSYSENKYNLKGNSHNYLFNYKWDMMDREVCRNHPIKTPSTNKQ